MGKITKAPPKNENPVPATAEKPAPRSIKILDRPIVGEAEDGLPNEDTDQTVSMTSLNWLFVAPPGFGKSELFALFPEALVASVEGGHKFIKGRKIIIDEWSGKGEAKDDDGNIHMSFLEFLNRIENSERYKFIVIDTLDALAKKCIDHHVGAANQAHLSDLGDFGKGFDLGQNDPIRKAINRILATGRGIGFITHQEIKTNTFKKKGPESKKETSLPNGIYKIVYPQVDIIIHGEFGGVRDGQEHKDRIIRAQGDEDVLAKNRGGILPPAWISPLDKDERISQLMGFFAEDEEERAANIAAATAEYTEFYG